MPWPRPPSSTPGTWLRNSSGSSGGFRSTRPGLYLASLMFTVMFTGWASWFLHRNCLGRFSARPARTYRFCFWRWLQNQTRTTFFFRSSFSAIALIRSPVGRGCWRK